MKQLVGAALYLQEVSIFHRDIKLENILIQTNKMLPTVRLIDFGLSCFVKDRSTYSSFFGKMSGFDFWLQNINFLSSPSDRHISLFSRHSPTRPS